MAITPTLAFDEIVDGRRVQMWTIVYTSAGTTTEATLSPVPVVGVVRRMKVHRTNGTAAGNIPKIGTIATFVASTINEVVPGPGSQQAHYDSNSLGNSVGYTYVATGAKLYFRPNPTGGSTDNEGTALIHIEGGMSP
jgi:hypothetical protein